MIDLIVVVMLEVYPNETGMSRLIGNKVPFSFRMLPRHSQAHSQDRTLADFDLLVEVFDLSAIELNASDAIAMTATSGFGHAMASWQ